MTVTVKIPDQLASQLNQGSDEALSRQFLEAFLLHRFAEGEMTSMQVGEVLGLSFYQVQQFLHDHHAPPDLTIEEYRRQLADLDEMISE